MNSGDYSEWLALATKRLAEQKLDEAIACYRRAGALLPDSAELHVQTGVALCNLGRAEDALPLLIKAVELRPDLAETHNALGMALMGLGRIGPAIERFRKVVELRPDEPRGFNNLAGMLGLAGRAAEAIAALRQAIALCPTYASAYHNLGNALKDYGDVDQAIACYEKAESLGPSYDATTTNRLYALHFSPAYDVAAIDREHRRWGGRLAANHVLLPHDNDPSPERRLRIGYLSPDLRQHVVGWNLRPLLRCHDHRQIEVFCYASIIAPDALTTELRGYADHWREVLTLSDEQVADQIRRDRIDILVDLALLLGGSRLPVFVRKPAPIQATYLAYCSTSGLAAMDYRFSDPHLDPGDEQYFREQTLRLPRTYWCYEPGFPTPEPAPLPALSRGHITFGCLNTFAKASAPALALWATVLKSVPNARLIVHGPALGGDEVVANRFAQAGVPLDRLEIAPRLVWDKYIEQFSRIDIALDPFPYAGGITSCDGGLWMGVPLITLRGQTPVGRGGASILHAVGLPELIAESPQEYVRMAVELANDWPRLAQIRATLRARMKASPLMDGDGFARDVEAAYRQVWRKWCAQQTVC